MNAKYFFDTNILLYAVSAEPKEFAKTEIAPQLLQKGGFGTSVQVLQEFYVNATRRISKPYSKTKAIVFMEWLAEFPILPIAAPLVLEAIEMQERFQISYWDAAIIAAAHELKASILYTEDLNHGQKYGEVQAINPFK